MIRIHHAGKMGDVIYALPVMKALARIHQTKIHLMTSGLCHQLVPLLWEQPYFQDVDIDDTRPYGTQDDIMTNWDYYKEGEGINLSLQPRMKTMMEPSWTQLYMTLCGVEALTENDCLAMPSLVNHRRWMYGMTIALNGVVQEMHRTFIVAPEVQTLDSAPADIWMKVIDRLLDYGVVMLVGKSRVPNYDTLVQSWNQHAREPFLTDLRGLTTVPVLARLIAECRGFIGAHSFPWHLARQSETPAVCLQHWLPGLYRCRPVDTVYTWLEPSEWQQGVDQIVNAVTMKEETHGVYR